MPILNQYYRAELNLPDGRSQQIPAAQALQLQGPLVEVLVTPPAVVLEALQKRGDQLPELVKGHALIDTGASVTCIDMEIARQLQLAEVGTATMQSATHADVPTPVYHFALVIQGVGLRFETARGMGATLGAQGIVALIGRDALSTCLLVYNGATGSISLAL